MKHFVPDRLVMTVARLLMAENVILEVHDDINYF